MPSGVFSNNSGTPTAPQFVEMVITGYTEEQNGTLKPCINVMHFRSFATSPGGSMTTLVDNFRTALGDTILNVTTADFHWVANTGRYMDDPTVAAVVRTVGEVGNIEEDRQPSFVSGVIRKLTDARGKNYRGSIHFGAVPESFTTKDQLTGAGLTAYNLLRDAFYDLISDGISDGVNTFYPIVLSTTLSDLFSNPSVFTGAYIASYSTNLKLGTMKRRKEKSVA